MIKQNVISASISRLKLSTAFFDATPGWKLDADGNFVKDASGNPIYVNSAGKDQSVGGDTISSLNAEAQRFRVRAETAEGSLKKFEGITDPVAALDAIDKLSKIDQKTLIAAGEVDRVKADIAKQYDGKLAERDAKIAEVNAKYNNTLITNAFAMSPFVKEKLSIPPDVAQSFFANRLTVGEDGKITAKDVNGNPMLSQRNMGANADFEEAVEMMVGGYANKDHIMKGDGQSGTGNTGGGGNGNTGTKKVSIAEMGKMAPVEAAATAKLAREGKVILTE